MNAGRFIIKILSALTLVFAVFCAQAEVAPFRVVEIGNLSIKLGKDGIGIVKGIECEGCDFKYVRITKDSKASIDGKDVSIMEAKKRAGKFVMVSFNPETREVQYIRW